MSAPAIAGTRREAILAHLAAHPDLTAHEIARAIGAASHITDLLRNMESKAQVVSRPGCRPGHGRPVHVWRIAPPGTIPPPRPPVPAGVLACRRARDRRNTAARRARARGPLAGALDLPGAACRGEDPDLFFPGSAEDEAKAVAICSACPARAACRDRAVLNGEQSGIWGGINFEHLPRKERTQPS